MDQTQLNANWEQILKKLEDSLSQIVCETWLKPLIPLSLTTTTLELGTPTGFSKEWIEKHYIPFIIDASYEVTKARLAIDITSLNTELNNNQSEIPLPQTLSRPTSSLQEQKDAATTSYQVPFQTTMLDDQNQPIIQPEIPSPIAPGDSFSLNPKYVFETFVTGNSNRFAHAAALAVAE